MCANRGPGPVNGDWGGMVGVWGLRPGWAVGFGFGVGAEWGPGPVDVGLVSGLVNADWGPVNADLEPRPGFTSPSEVISFGNS